MQDARNPEERGVLMSTLQWWRMSVTQQMDVFQQPCIKYQLVTTTCRTSFCRPKWSTVLKLKAKDGKYKGFILHILTATVLSERNERKMKPQRGKEKNILVHW